MKLVRCFKHAFRMMVHSKLRSWLTIIGIVIGVAAVIAIISISEGLQQAVNQRLGGLGGDILTITPGFPRGEGNFGMHGPGGGEGGGGSQATNKTIVLARSDFQVLRGVPNVLLMDTNIRGSVSVSYLGKSGRVSVTGVDQKVWSQITTNTLREGRMLDPSDQNVIVIGGRLASSYFSKPVGINQMISVGSSSFRVVGIIDDQSNSIYMPIQMAYQVIPDKTNGIYDAFVVKVRDESLLNDTMANINNRLMMARHVNLKADFSVVSNQQIQQTRAALLSTMTAFLVAIAAVSLIVGAVGVANTMFTSVLERTKDIGIMKAIGARNQDIMLIFLFNSGFIGLVGGAIGTLFGAVLSGLLPSLMGGTPIGEGVGIAVVSMRSVVLALSVSATVGVLAGIVPAYRASRLHPVDALRYE